MCLMPLARAFGFIDESGQRAVTLRSSRYFVMSAVLINPNALPRASTTLATLRSDLNRDPGHELHWQQIKSHEQKVHVARTIGASHYLHLCSVVVVKNEFRSALPHEDYAYLYTLRLLLERMSWWARSTNVVLEYTLAHVVRFKLSALRRYENKLRQLQDCSIEWAHLDPHGGRLDQPRNLEYLQLADLTASATAQAFEPGNHEVTERRYLFEIRPRIYCPSDRAITSYGLKVHPWNERTQDAHSWLMNL